MKMLNALFAGVLAAAFAGAGWAGERGTAAEAEVMVKKAVAYVRANGREKALVEFNKPSGPFVDRDLYIFATDLHGVSLANPSNQKMVGKDMSQIRDADGKYFNKERLETVAKHGKGWQEYRWVNPVTKKLETKRAYFEKVGDMVVACGTYKE
jgi:cytochrome c